MPRGRKYPQELVDRGVRLVFESRCPIAQVAADLGMHPEALRKRVRQAEIDTGRRDGLTSEEHEEIKKLRRENFELRRANEILKVRLGFFRQGARPETQASRYVDEHRGRFGVEPICNVLGVSENSPTTSAQAGGALSDRSRTSSCSDGSRRSMRPTTTPTGTGACGRRFNAPASRRHAALSSD